MLPIEASGTLVGPAVSLAGSHVTCGPAQTADETRADERTLRTYDGAFIESSEMAKLSIVDAAEKLEMPDPEQAAAAADLAWGFVNSFHMVAKRIEGGEDDAAKKLGEMARAFDPSEIYATELEETQLLCQTLEGCREALECMRDHAGEVFRVETGRPFSTTRGSKVTCLLPYHPSAARVVATVAASFGDEVVPLSFQPTADQIHPRSYRSVAVSLGWKEVAGFRKLVSVPPGGVALLSPPVESRRRTTVLVMR